MNEEAQSPIDNAFEQFYNSEANTELTTTLWELVRTAYKDAWEKSKTNTAEQ